MNDREILETIMLAAKALNEIDIAYIHLCEADWDDAPQIPNDFRIELRSNFKNTIIIMTSNIGSHLIQDAFEDVNETNVEEKTAQSKLEVMALLKQTIRPEFLNRVDDIIMFSPLLRKQMASIVQIQLKQLKSLVAENGMQIEFTDYLVEYLSEQGFDMQFGARPLKRLIQKLVVNELSKQILSGAIDKSKKVLIDIFDGVVVFRNEG